MVAMHSHYCKVSAHEGRALGPGIHPEQIRQNFGSGHRLLKMPTEALSCDPLSIKSLKRQFSLFILYISRHLPVEGTNLRNSNTIPSLSSLTFR